MYVQSWFSSQLCWQYWKSTSNFGRQYLHLCCFWPASVIFMLRRTPKGGVLYLGYWFEDVKPDHLIQEKHHPVFVAWCSKKLVSVSGCKPVLSISVQLEGYSSLHQVNSGVWFGDTFIAEVLPTWSSPRFPIAWGFWNLWRSNLDGGSQTNRYTELVNWLLVSDKGINSLIIEFSMIASVAVAMSVAEIIEIAGGQIHCSYRSALSIGSHENCPISLLRKEKFLI